MGQPGGAVLALLLGAAGATSCFDGANALGLPCVVDDDCGQGQSCEQGFCGGPPDSASADSGGSTSTTTGVDGSTTEDLMGDSSSTGTVEPVCGNEIVEDGEECDDGEEGSEECDIDCTEPLCGDGLVNNLAGEECDEPDRENESSCTDFCQEPLFFDDMEDPMETMGLWMTEIPVHTGQAGDFMLDVEGWSPGPPPLNGTWYSGAYSEAPGTAVLTSVPIEFPDELPDDFHFELHFTHSVRMDSNGVVDTDCAAQFSDGGIVRLMQPGMGPVDPPPPIQVGPPPGMGQELEEGGCMEISQESNPEYDDAMPRFVYSGATVGGFQEVVLELPDEIAGQMYQLSFTMSYDCHNCWDGVFPTDPPPVGWIIDDVLVAAYPDERD